MPYIQSSGSGSASISGQSGSGASPAAAVGAAPGAPPPREASTPITPSPYVASFFSPTPLMPPSPSTEVGHTVAISRSVASWKMT